jgi:hypothetical protein
MAVSKTDFVRGLQCKKMLWLDAHAPEYKIIPPEVQAKLDAGNEFGDQAMGIFGDFVETTTLREDGRLNFAAMLEKTKALLESGERVICEGSFSWYGNFCAADILKKEESGYALYEVKNTYFPRQEFITDLGFQRLILRKCGVNITSCNLVLRGDTPPEGIEDTKLGESERLLTHGDFLYKLVDVSKAARRADFMASNCDFELGKLKKKEALMPEIEMGEHCCPPYRCWYYEYCSKGKE